MTERLPRWRDVANSLSEGIRNGIYEPGKKLPTENDLARHFQLNRHTIRRALEELASIGMIRTEQGRGSFVCDDPVEYRIHARPRFSELMKDSNRPTTRRKLSLRRMALVDAPDRALARDLLGGVPDVIVLERIGYSADRPVSYSRHIFDAGLHEGLMAALEAHDSITEALRKLGLESVRRRTQVSTRCPDSHEASLLRIELNDPILRTVGYNVTPAGRPIEISIGHYPGRRMQLAFENFQTGDQAGVVGVSHDPVPRSDA